MQIVTLFSLRILGPGALAALIAAGGVTSGGPVSGVGTAMTVRAPTSVALTTSVPSHGISDPHPAPTTAGSGPDQRLRFGWPLSPQPAVHRGFEQPLHPWSRGHRGADLLAAVGQQVLSAGDGVVAFSGMIAGRGVITVRHVGGLRTSYEPVDERLATGAAVHRGARLGVISSVTGHCTPLTCLHWGAISGQAYLDPLSLLSAGRPILLPLR